MVPEECFEGDLFKSFWIGIETDQEQYCSEYNVVSVPMKNAKELSDVVFYLDDESIATGLDGAALMEVVNEPIIGSIKNVTENDLVDGSLCAVAYDSLGAYICADYQSVSVEVGKSVEFVIDFQTNNDIYMVMITIMDSITMEPFSDPIVIKPVSFDMPFIDAETYGFVDSSGAETP